MDIQEQIEKIENSFVRNNEEYNALKIELLSLKMQQMYSREEVVAKIKECLLATGGETIKTTMHFGDKSFVEFDNDDLEEWIKKNV